MSSPIIKHNLVQMQSTITPGGSSRERPRARKQARLVEVDGEARAIEVQCSCGESILVELAFEARAATTGAKKS